jgi:hypothetical protein
MSDGNDNTENKIVEHVQAQPIQIKISRGPGGRYDYDVSLYGSDPEDMIHQIKTIVDRLDMQYPYIEKEKSK